MSEPLFDSKVQLDSVEGVLLDGEKLDAVFDVKGVGTGIFGISSTRLIFGDKAAPNDLFHIQSVPYSRVYQIRCEGGVGGFLGKAGSSKLIVKAAGGDLELEFKSGDKARKAHDLILQRMVG